MFDRRVVRGNTYAAHHSIREAQLERPKPKRAPRQKPPGTPEPVEGRRHMDIQTEAYLEELADTVPEAEVMTQTDAFMDRPPTPLFIPMKIGVDVETQIESGDLFDFDFEVEPILEVLVGKTLEQGLMEVMEEEELAAMRAHQEHFEQIRNAELVATQRMEAAERRKAEERERRIAQERERIERQKAMREKVAAQTFARGYMSGLMGNVFDRLYDSGFFFDPVQREIETDFMPWFEDAVVAECSNAAVSRRCVDEIIKKAMLDAAAAKAAAAESVKEEMDAAAAKVAAEAEAEEAAKVAKAEERTALAQRVLDIFMAVPEVEGDGGDGEDAPTAEVTEEQATESQMALKEAMATSKREAMVEADEEQKNAFALEVLTLLIETPPADGEDAALTQEQVDEAKKALTPEPDPVVDEETPAGGDAEAPEDGDAEAPVDGDAEAPEDGDAAVEPEPAPEPEPVPEPTSDAILAHLIEAGTVTDEAIMKVLTPTMPEPTADELLNHLLENEVVSAEKVAKALVAKALEEEAAAEAERKAAEEEAAAEAERKAAEEEAASAAAAAAEAAAPPDGADEQPPT